MKDIYCLAIESSCDETSMSIIKNGEEEIATVVYSQIDIHKKFGGVVPEVASRSHIECVTIVLDELLIKSKMSINDIDIIGVTYGPGLIGSLLIGLQCAKTIALVTKKPLIPVHHIAGHIYANNLEKRLEFPLVALVVSGGHTDLVYMDKDYSFKRIGSTLDDAVGEAYDKVAKIIGLEYPGGPKIDKLASDGKDSYDLPYPLNDDSYNFSFSGIKSATLNLVHNEKQRGNDIRVEDVCTTFQNRVVSVITKKTMKAVKEYNVKNLVMAGGVAANRGLRESLAALCKENDIKFSVPRIEYCTDNAAMIGAAAYYAYKKGIVADLELNAMATDSLYKETKV
jgi:N6-L-threonylcarbamoyladenine synthase